MTTFEYKGKIYPQYLNQGNAQQFIMRFAQQFCQGSGLDVGGDGGWTLPGAKPINITIDDRWDAMRLPPGEFDYIFSSHTLEHLSDWRATVEYWQSKLVKGGTLFLYLPHKSMELWSPENMREHLHSFEPWQIKSYMEYIGFKDIFASDRDLYWSFAVTGKREG